jgi:hypothetical protein
MIVAGQLTVADQLTKPPPARWVLLFSFFFGSG